MVCMCTKFTLTVFYLPDEGLRSANIGNAALQLLYYRLWQKKDLAHACVLSSKLSRLIKKEQMLEGSHCLMKF